MDSELFQVLDARFLVSGTPIARFQIPCAESRIPKPRIPDFTCKILLELRNPDYLR